MGEGIIAKRDNNSKMGYKFKKHRFKFSVATRVVWAVVDSKNKPRELAFY